MTRSVGGCRPDSKACLSCRWGIKTRSRSRVRTNHGRSKSRGAQPAGQRRSNHCVYSCMIRRRLEAGYQGAGPQTPSTPSAAPSPRIKPRQGVQGAERLPRILALGRVPPLRNNTPRTPHLLHQSIRIISTIMSSRPVLRALARSPKLQHRTLSTSQSCLARKHPNGYAPPAREDLEELRERTREFARM